MHLDAEIYPWPASRRVYGFMGNVLGVSSHQIFRPSAVVTSEFGGTIGSVISTIYFDGKWRFQRPGTVYLSLSL